MFIADYLETSLLDWEGKIACLLFLSGCNFRCPWCQNKELALGIIKNSIPIQEILAKFENKKNWIDGFVITGGEPTINRDLGKIISEIKNNGFLVKLDTNGSNPTVIKELIDNKLVDSVAMDIKSSLTEEKYNNACGINVELTAIKKTVEILLSSSIDCFFRTTVVPGIVDEDDILKIAQMVKGKEYRMQKFVPHNTLDENYIHIKPYSEQDMKKMEEICYAKLF